MVTETFYIKRGRRYVPVREYDAMLQNALPHGSYVTVVRPGASVQRWAVDPAYAPMIAAGIVAREAMSKVMLAASEVRLSGERKPMTQEQRDAWENLIAVFGPAARQLEHPSVMEVTQAGVDAMIAEAERLLTHPSVRSAYEHFITVSKLVEDYNERV
jgi:hypothetical protein